MVLAKWENIWGFKMYLFKYPNREIFKIFFLNFCFRKKSNSIVIMNYLKPTHQLYNIEMFTIRSK